MEISGKKGIRLMNDAAEIIQDADLKFEHDKYLAIASLTVGLLFEYDVKTDTMINMLNRDGRFMKAVSVADFSSECYGLVAGEDEGALDAFIKELHSNKQHVETELRFFSKTKKKYEWSRLEGFRVVSEDGARNVVVGKIMNIDQEKQQEKQKREEALKDPLTGMFNREAAAKRVDQCLENRRGKELQAFFLVDIEGFNEINKSMGKIFGDEVLKNVAADIRKSFYSSDIMGRVGVDRFVVLMRDAGSLSNIMRKSVQLREILDNTYTGEKLGNMKGTIGAAVAPMDGSSFETLLEKADKAMLYARKYSSNGIEIYEPGKEDIYTLDYDERERRREYTPVIELSGGNNGGDSIIQLAFKLIEETKDADSAVNMLIRRMTHWLNLTAISVMEVTKEPYTLKCMYEYSRDGRVDNAGREKTFSKTCWDKMLTCYSIHQGICIKDKETPYEGSMDSEPQMDQPEMGAVVQCAFYEGGEYMGSVSYIDNSSDRVWKPEDRNIMSILTNIIFSYMLKMRSFEAARSQVERLNAYDQATGLLKFDRFRSMAENVIMSGRGNRFLIIYSDIYNFKYINERYGYDAGDRLLKKFADYFMASGTKEVLGCRMISDNFISFAPCPFSDSKEELDTFVRNIMETNAKFAATVREQYEGSNVMIASGICLFDRRHTSLMKALSYANLARKRAKKPGQSNCILYNEQMGQEIMRQMAYLSELNAALQNREFVVFLQPKVDAATGYIVGSEALVRWKKPDGTLIFPGDFIPVFEENRMVKELDFYVYEEVFRYIRDCLDNGKKVVPISVNASRDHLTNKTELRDHLAELLEKYGIPPEYIEVELTENILIEDMNEVVDIINSIRAMGIKVSMDDFGSGYSSLNVLKKIPLDVLKLDKAFMDDMDENCKDDIIISSIIDMSKKMGLKVLCEGVETGQQVRFLAEAGCDMIQGYYFSKPVDVENFERLLDEEVLHGKQA